MSDLARSARDLEAVLAWQDQIQNHQVDCLLIQDLAHPRTIRGHADAIALLRQVGVDRAPDFGLVVDHQDVPCFAHRSSRTRSFFIPRRLGPERGGPAPLSARFPGQILAPGFRKSYCAILQPGFPRWLLPIADKRSTKGVSERVRPYTGTIDHDLPLYWASWSGISSTPSTSRPSRKPSRPSPTSSAPAPTRSSS